MNFYNVAFNIKRVHSVHSYDEFFSVLESMDHGRFWDTNYVVCTPESVGDLRERLSQYLHPADQIFISNINAGWTAIARTEGLQWLVQHENQAIEQTNLV